MDPETNMTVTTKFVVNLTRTLYEPGKNMVLSPFSVVSALAMVMAGAGHPSSTELLDILFSNAGTKNKNCAKEEECKTILNQYTNELANFFKDNETVLNNANLLYSRKQFSVKESYVEMLKKNFMATAKQLDFSKPEALVEINEDVSKATKKLIPKFLEEIQPNIVVILINAIYFKGLWKYPFPKEETISDAKFYASNGSSFRVPIMAIKKKFPHYYCEELQLDTLRIEYSEGTVSMVILLPDPDTSVKNVLDKLNQEKLTEILYRMDCFQDVNLKLPRFKLETTHELNEPLKRLGVKTIFGGDANLSGISEDPLLVTEIVQKAVIEVNEEGTEAAAATRVMMARCMALEPHEFNCNRTFMFLLVSNNNNHVLFSGVVEDPRTS